MVCPGGFLSAVCYIFSKHMQDIKIPDVSSSKRPLFEKAHVSGAEFKAADPKAAETAGDKVKVKFEKFVQLVATHDFEEVMKKHAEEDIVMSTNLLTDLANAHVEEEGHGKKIPIFLIVGIIIGIVATYLIIRF